MGIKTMDKLEALGLIVGPVLALLFFLFEPGALIIDPAEIGDAVGIITALASNQTMAHVSSLVVPLGLVLMLYGLAGINRVIQENRMAAALSRLGILCMTIGVIGWILSAGLTHVLAETRIEVEQALQRAMSVYIVDSGVTIISGMIVAAGFIAFSLGLAALSSPGFGRVAAVVITAVSVVALIAFIIGHIGGNSSMITVARACYFPWVAWSVLLGVNSLKGTGLTGVDDR